MVCNFSFRSFRSYAVSFDAVDNMRRLTVTWLFRGWTSCCPYLQSSCLIRLLFIPAASCIFSVYRGHIFAQQIAFFFHSCLERSAAPYLASQVRVSEPVLPFVMCLNEFHGYLPTIFITASLEFILMIYCRRFCKGFTLIPIYGIFFKKRILAAHTIEEALNPKLPDI